MTNENGTSEFTAEEIERIFPALFTDEEIENMGLGAFTAEEIENIFPGFKLDETEDL